MHIAPQYHLAAIALLRGAGVDRGTGGHGHLGGLAQVAAALPVTAHQHVAAACGASGADEAGASQGDVVTFQGDDAAFVADAVGFQAAAVADHAGLQFVQSHSRQDDLPIWGLHGLAVVDQAGNGAGRGGDAGQARAAVEVERDGIASSHGHRACLRHDDTRIAHFRREQRDVAAQRRVQAAFVDHGTRGAVAAKRHVAGHEGVVTDAVCGGGECAHVGLCRGREVNAARVAQKHLAVGVDLAVDLAGVLVGNAVERDSLAAGLVEGDAGVLTHIEGVPVDDCALAALVDRHGIAALANAGSPTRHYATRGQLSGRWWGLLGMGQAGDAGQRHAGHRGCHGATCAAGAGALALTSGDFRDNLPALGRARPDQAIKTIERSVSVHGAALEREGGVQPHAVELEGAVAVCASTRAGDGAGANAACQGGAHLGARQGVPGHGQAIAFERDVVGCTACVQAARTVGVSVVLVRLDVAMVIKTGQGEVAIQLLAQFSGQGLAFRTTAFTGRVRTHTAGTAQVQALTAVQVFVGTLHVQRHISVQTRGQGLQAAQAHTQLAEAACCGRATGIGALVGRAMQIDATL